MKVGVDARHLAGDRGVAHYTGAILSALAAAHPQDEWRLLVPGRRPLPHPLLTDPPPNVSVVRTAVPGRVLHGSAAVARRPRADRVLGDDIDVFFLTAPSPVAVTRGVPLVVVVHDLAFDMFPSDFTFYERFWHRRARLADLAHRAYALIACSETTRREILTRWGPAPDRVTTVLEGVEEAPPVAAEAIAATRARHGVDERYLLCVGALEPRKQPELLVAAHSRAVTDGLRAQLVFAGDGRLAGRCRASGARVLGRVSGEDLAALYAGAVALVMPSRLEGFGFPPLQALRHGTPAVVADLPVYEETLGRGALRFASGDESSLARALLEIAADATLRTTLVQRGLAASAPLTWERCRAATYDILTRAAHHARAHHPSPINF